MLPCAEAMLYCHTRYGIMFYRAILCRTPPCHAMQCKARLYHNPVTRDPNTYETCRWKVRYSSLVCPVTY